MCYSFIPFYYLPTHSSIQNEIYLRNPLLTFIIIIFMKSTCFCLNNKNDENYNNNKNEKAIRKYDNKPRIIING